jgi:uridine kinase
MSEIVIKVENKEYKVPAFTSAEEVFVKAGLLKKGYSEKPINYLDNPIIGAFVNGELRPIGSHIQMSCEVKPIRAFDSFGRRIYRHSICFLLSYATKLVFPKRHLVIGHALGDGFYFSFDDGYNTTATQIKSLVNKMNQLVQANLQIKNTYLSLQEALSYFKEEGYEATSLLLESQNDPFVGVYIVSNGKQKYCNIAYEPIVPNTSVLSVWELSKYGNCGMLLRYPVAKNVTTLVPARDNSAMYKVYVENKRWGKFLGISCLGELNRCGSENGLAQYVRMSETLQRRKIAEIADTIVAGKKKAVFVAGPSSSGKTTFAKRVCEQLRLLDHEPIRISLDDYYKKRCEAPIDEDGKPDLEALEALNIDLFDQNMKDLFAGKEVDLPKFSFQSQETYYENKPIRLTEKTIFVIEGLHGLNPKITSKVEEKYGFKIYISALTQLNLDDCNRVSTTDDRILRRVLRDYRTRNASAEETLLMWPSVARGERIHIFPNQNNADVMFNSALDYEIGVLSPFVQPLLKEVSPSSGEAYTQARRLLSFLRNVYPIPSHLVPSDSLLREFIGGSDYE